MARARPYSVRYFASADWHPSACSRVIERTELQSFKTPASDLNSGSSIFAMSSSARDIRSGEMIKPSKTWPICFVNSSVELIALSWAAAPAAKHSNPKATQKPFKTPWFISSSPSGRAKVAPSANAKNTQSPAQACARNGAAHSVLLRERAARAVPAGDRPAAACGGERREGRHLRRDRGVHGGDPRVARGVLRADAAPAGDGDGDGGDRRGVRRPHSGAARRDLHQDEADHHLRDVRGAAVRRPVVQQAAARDRVRLGVRADR